MSDHLLLSALSGPVWRSTFLSALGFALLFSLAVRCKAKATPPPAQLDEGLSGSALSTSPSPLWLPPDKRSSWRALLESRRPRRTLVSLHYGDSHTQGAYLSRALRDELSTSPPWSILDEPSPGFVHVGHPHSWGGAVELDGYWLRQNWIYGGDQGPFGPLGISLSLIHI